jgi:hypothetical protein
VDVLQAVKVQRIGRARQIPWDYGGWHSVYYLLKETFLIVVDIITLFGLAEAHTRPDDSLMVVACTIANQANDTDGEFSCLYS